MFCFLIKEDPSEATGVSATSKTGTEQFVLLDEEQEGQPLPKRRRPGEKQKPGLSHCHHPHTSRKMRERNSPTIKEDSEVSSLVDYIHETTKHTVQRTLRTSPLYRKTQSSNGCQMFSSGRQFFSSEAVPLCSSSTLPPAASAPDANLLSPSHQAANLE
ncbi:uncharacterized protein LOC117764957 isoform X4 [Hippoglossus hippoglossus]|uniref:uncharacterized protein LOC117764957 isoform X4 n=1 Tax=Hippoglossus hippoglossus TaxID=8267 RepID=UPI00148E4486|nr:uncharacterized protein LOC117764957 isoform X4 [Hippoglossus hippoglossus]